MPSSDQTLTQLQLGAELVLVPILPAPGRPTDEPASQRSTFKPQITIIVKRTFVSSVIKSQKKIILDLIPYHLPIHQTQKDLNLN